MGGGFAFSPRRTASETPTSKEERVSHADTLQRPQGFYPRQMQRLFLPVGWPSGRYPEKLAAAMRNSATVYSAWEDGKPIGLINALNGGVNSLCAFSIGE